MSTASIKRDNETKEWIKTLFQTYEDRINGQKDQPIHQFKKSAFDELMNEDFPTRKDEDWKYTNVTPLIKKQYRQCDIVSNEKVQINNFTFEGLDTIQIVLINGILDDKHSNIENLPSGLSIMTMDDALNNPDHNTQIQNLISTEGGTAKNVFLRLNRVFAKHGYIIITDKNATIEIPIHFININTIDGDNYFSHPQLFVIGKQNSNVTVIESYHTTNKESRYFSNAVCYVEVEDNANVDHYRLQFTSENANQINNTIVTQGRDSVYTNYAIDLGGKLVRSNLSTELKGSGTETNYFGAYLGTNSQHIDNQTFIDHALPHCNSNEVYKGILSDKSRGVFNGKIIVRQDAQKTNAFQQNNSLVLSDTAIMNAKPQLEIYADDVKCSHGATIGQLDESSVFYLQSRGFSKVEAKNLLQKAFLGDVIMNFKLEPIRSKMLHKIDLKLEGKL